MNAEGKLPFIFENIGKWWGNNPIKKIEEEIDIVAYDKKNILLGECKWHNSLVDMSVVKKLMDKGALFHFENKFYILFSKNGFTKETLNFAKASNNVILISFKDFVSSKMKN
jgi:hypothetical protein